MHGRLSRGGARAGPGPAVEDYGHAMASPWPLADAEVTLAHPAFFFDMPCARRFVCRVPILRCAVLYCVRHASCFLFRLFDRTKDQNGSYACDVRTVVGDASALRCPAPRAGHAAPRAPPRAPTMPAVSCP